MPFYRNQFIICLRSFIFFIIIIGSFFSSAQVRTIDFGIKFGLNLTFYNGDEGDFGQNAQTETDAYGGIFADFHIDEYFSIQTEALYIGLGDFKFINAPIYCKYALAEDLNFMVGPSMNYFFNLFNRRFKVRGDVCASYDISPTFDFHIKYTLGFQILTPDVLFVGLGCRF